MVEFRIRSGEQWGKVETAVWWDFDKCPLPEDRDPEYVGDYIRLSLQLCGLSGRIRAFAFGDVSKLPESDRFQASVRCSMNLKLTHLDGSWIKRYIEDWARQHPDTKKYMIISDDLELCESVYDELIKNQDRELFTAHTKGYDKSSSFLTTAPTLVWNFRNLVHVGYPEKCLDKYIVDESKLKFVLFVNKEREIRKVIMFPPLPNLPMPSFREIDLSGVKLSVWWDIESCLMPKNCDVAGFPLQIQHALLNIGLFGPITIFTDTTRITNSYLRFGYPKEFFNIVCVKREEMVEAMEVWSNKNLPPATCLLITNSDSFISVFSVLVKLLKYDVLVAHDTDRACAGVNFHAIITMSRCIWKWSSLAHGDAPAYSRDHSGSLKRKHGEVDAQAEL